MSGALPLFPLHAVLLPGAALDLRIFEARYLDMVRECGRTGGGFGVTLIIDGSEAGSPAASAAYGTEARIEDFGTTDEGLLSLRVRGHRRFRVQRTRVRDNGLVIGEVHWLEEPVDAPLRPEHALLGELLRRILVQVGGEHAQADPRQLEDAAWVGWRLGELLPLLPAQRQLLLQTADPHARLQQLLDGLGEDGG